jgi:hypothetical protein
MHEVVLHRLAAEELLEGRSGIEDALNVHTRNFALQLSMPLTESLPIRLLIQRYLNYIGASGCDDFPTC